MKKVLIIIILIFYNAIYLFGYNSESIKIKMPIFLSENCVICDDSQIHHIAEKIITKCRKYFPFGENKSKIGELRL